MQALGGGWHRFGYASVSNFGTPLSMRAYARERGLHFPPRSTMRRATRKSSSWRNA